MLQVEAQRAKVIEISEMIEEVKMKHERKLAHPHSVHLCFKKLYLKKITLKHIVAF